MFVYFDIVTRMLRNATLSARRSFCTVKQNFKVGLMGAGGGVGQSMSLILKLSPLSSELSLYDIDHTPGLAEDLSHVCSTTKVLGYKGVEERDQALKGCDIVMVASGMARKPGMIRDDLFHYNAVIIKDVAEAIFMNCPMALVGLVTDPINSLLPVMHEAMKNVGNCDPRRIFGVTTLDVVRTKTLLGNFEGKNPMDMHIPVIGGHSSETIIPLFSRASPNFELEHEEVKRLTKRVQEAGDEIVNANQGAGSAKLSMAFAGSKFALALCRGLNGDKDIVECAYVKSTVTESSYFSTPLVLGRNGLEENLGTGKLSEYEHDLVQSVIPILKQDIKRGLAFIKAA